MAAIRPRTVVRGRTDDPVARLQTAEGAATQPSRFSLGLWGAILFISSEVMFFAALFTTYFYLRTKLPHWEPIFGEKPSWNGLPGLITILLVSSSFTMQAAIIAIQRGSRTWLRNWLVITLVLGGMFLAGQAYEYAHLGFLPPDGIFAAVFFTLTGFHGAHVFGGFCFISWCLVRTLRGQFSARRHLAVEAASMYWHFVDVVWIGLFITIYIVG